MLEIYTVEKAEDFINGKYDEELEDYLSGMLTRRQREIFTEDDCRHIMHCLKSLVADLFSLYPAGDLKTILQNDLFETVGVCDSINILFLNLYVKFLYNNVPVNLLWKKRKLIE